MCYTISMSDTNTFNEDDVFSELEKLEQEVADLPPAPEVVLEAPPEQEEVKPVKKAVAKKTSPSKKEEESSPVFETYHIVNTGLTIAGEVRVVGTEFRIERDSVDWRATQDRSGNSFLDLADKEDEQVARYGKVMFRKGSLPSD